ncbi:c-type cytochrome [Flavihumibacter profundi]|uniref:c-type cytochrome n=1 Tax=Flavihumibacter profundi TaxID=2716883 RepID=UPI001CC504C8|nr:cytochrome c [Flavihumibacter profundi]MBZ5855858.1 cytochrome c [Flavihumibacter profundi]
MKYAFIISGFILLGNAANSYRQDPKAESIKRGQEVYINNCQSCHMEKGEGVENSFPPLAKADYLMKDPKRTIGIILKGQNEPIIVNGKPYNMLMPAQDYLTDEQIADVVNYIANSWGNTYKPLIVPDQVKKAR